MAGRISLAIWRLDAALRHLSRSAFRRTDGRHSGGPDVRNRRFYIHDLCRPAGRAKKSSGLARGARPDLDARPSLARALESAAHRVSLRVSVRTRLGRTVD